MKVEKYDGSQDRHILEAMICHPEVLSRIVPKWDGDMFQSRSMNLIAGWCVKHYQRHNTSPGKNIQSLFWKWADKRGDEDTIKQVERILTDMNIESDPADINVGYIIDLAGERFNVIRTQRTCEQALEDISAGRFTDAHVKVEQYSRVELGVHAGINLFNDKEYILNLFNQEQSESLVEYPGDLGKFFGDSLSRDSFVTFAGPAKAGKTWYLVDLAYRAMCQRRRVAFFEVGDLSEKQISMRFLGRVAHRPTRSDTGWPCVVQYPERITRTGNTSSVVHKEREYTSALGGKEALAASEKLLEKTIKSKKPYFKLSVHPNFSITVLGIKSILEEWASEGWNADVIVIDYADLLAPINPKNDKRDQSNDTWKHLRAISQVFHCLVVTATQTNAQSYNVETLSRKHFSEDNRKWAHVSAAIGINTDADEKEMGVSRLNYIVRREGAFSSNRCVHLAQCLPLGNPAVLSTF